VPFSMASNLSPPALPAPKPQPSRLNQVRSRTLGDVGVSLGGRAVAVPEQRPYDFLPGAHDGVAAAGGVARLFV
jgi:hypothetical protein